MINKIVNKKGLKNNDTVTENLVLSLNAHQDNVKFLNEKTSQSTVVLDINPTTMNDNKVHYNLKE